MTLKMKFTDDFWSTAILSLFFGLLLFMAISSSFASTYIVKIVESGQNKVEERMDDINILKK